MCRYSIKRSFWLVLTLFVFFMAGCEVDEVFVASSSSGVSFLFTGRWNGGVATAYGGSQLRLDESRGAINGMWYSPDGTRTLSGTSSGSGVVLYIQGGDVWRLRLSDDVLVGTGYRTGSGEYPVHFTRAGN